VQVPSADQPSVSLAGLGWAETLVLVGLLLAAAGESAAIWLHSTPIAVATIAGYGVAFALLAVYRLPLAFVALVLALPLITIETGFGDVQMTLSADKVALAAVVGVWLLRRLAAVRAALARIPGVRWWLAFLAVVVVSGVYNGISVLQVWSLLGQIVYLGVFLLALDMLATRSTRERTMQVAGLTAVVVGVLAVAEGLPLAWSASPGMYFKQGTMSDFYIPGSTIAHANFLGGYLVLLLPSLAAVSLTGNRRWKIGSLVGAVVIGLGLVWTRSVGAWAGLATGTLLAVGLAFKGSLREVGRWGALGALVVLVVGTGVWRVKLQVASGAASFPIRRATYEIGLAALTERPVLGFGASGYGRQSPRIERMLYGDKLGKFHTPGSPLSAHSSFIDIAVERGLVGLVVFAGLLASILAPGLRGSVREGDPTQRLLLLGVLAGLVAFVVQAFTENLFQYSKVAAMFWIMAAALVRLSEAAPERPAA